jgi:hypothetical protein
MLPKLCCGIWESSEETMGSIKRNMSHITPVTKRDQSIRIPK